MDRDSNDMPRRIESLAKEIIHRTGDGILELGPAKPIAIEGHAGAAQVVDVKKKPGRAFIHKLTNQYLAESGKVYI